MPWDRIIYGRSLSGHWPWSLLYRHALRNALLPVVSYIGPLAAALMTGSFIVETIFAIPGLGRHFVTSIYNRDYTVILGITIFYSFLIMMMNYSSTSSIRS